MRVVNRTGYRHGDLLRAAGLLFGDLDDNRWDGVQGCVVFGYEGDTEKVEAEVVAQTLQKRRAIGVLLPKPANGKAIDKKVFYESCRPKIPAAAYDRSWVKRSFIDEDQYKIRFKPDQQERRETRKTNLEARVTSAKAKVREFENQVEIYEAWVVNSKALLEAARTELSQAEAALTVVKETGSLARVKKAA